MKALATALVFLLLAGCTTLQGGYNYAKYATELKLKSAKPAYLVAACIASKWKNPSLTKAPPEFQVTSQIVPFRHSVLVTAPNVRGESYPAALVEISDIATGSRLSYYAEVNIIGEAQYAETMATCI